MKSEQTVGSHPAGIIRHVRELTDSQLLGETHPGRHPQSFFLHPAADSSSHPHPQHPMLALQSRRSPALLPPALCWSSWPLAEGEILLCNAMGSPCDKIPPSRAWLWWLQRSEAPQGAFLAVSPSSPCTTAPVRGCSPSRRPQVPTSMMFFWKKPQPSTTKGQIQPLIIVLPLPPASPNAPTWLRKGSDLTAPGQLSPSWDVHVLQQPQNNSLHVVLTLWELNKPFSVTLLPRFVVSHRFRQWPLMRVGRKKFFDGGKLGKAANFVLHGTGPILLMICRGGLKKLVFFGHLRQKQRELANTCCPVASYPAKWT